MKVVLCEKPSVAKSIADGLCHLTKLPKSAQGSHLQVGDYAVTWAFGHLVQLDIDAISGDFNNTSVFPTEWKYVPITSKDKTREKSSKLQLEAIKKLLRAAETIIVATDPGREGELIARLIMNYSLSPKELSSKTLKRFWTSESVDNGVVAKHFSSLRNGSEFDSLYKEALARQHADFLVGIYLTRAFKTSIGRVQTPTLAVLVDRETEILDFQPVDFTLINGAFEKDGFEFVGRFQRITETLNDKEAADLEENDGSLNDEAKKCGLTKAEAESLSKIICEYPDAEITKVDLKRRNEPPPLLHSVTSAQIEANKKFGFSGVQTLGLLQSLYETHKVLSYPRTESNHLATGNIELVKTAIKDLGREDLLPKVDASNKRIFDNDKLTDHHALIPLKPAPPTLSEDERKVYNIVSDTFIAAFYPDAISETFTIITTVANQYHFLTRGTRDLELGWKNVLLKNSRAYSFDLKEGTIVDLKQMSLVHEQTKPPSRYTEASLLKVMANAHLLIPSEQKEMRNVMKNKEIAGLGTGATRASIIQKIIDQTNVEKKGKFLVPTEKGMKTIQALRPRCKVHDPIMTAEWEAILEKIRKGSMTYEKFLDGIKMFVDKEREMFSMLSAEERASIVNRKAPEGQKIAKAKCPCCGSPMVEADPGLFCTSKDTCGLKVWRNFLQKKLTSSELNLICSGEKVFLKGLTSKKTGKEFNSKVFFDVKTKGLAFDFSSEPFQKGKQQPRPRK